MTVQILRQEEADLETYFVPQVGIPTNALTAERLAEIYNQTRIDYIVPMPMNARRMEEYINHYDVDLDASIVSVCANQFSGIGMLGLRDQRAWITRLGVLPQQRGRKTGTFLMEALIEQARQRKVCHIQLEVINGNDPALRLFKKFGFEATRELLIICRPPSEINAKRPLPNAMITPLNAIEIQNCLQNRPAGSSWIDETASLVKLGNLQGYKLEMLNGQHGWIIFHTKSFQMSHFVFDASHQAYSDIVSTLLIHVHEQHPSIDSKIENLPPDHQSWQLFQALGYVESFRRTEMILQL